ncbi:hypothetical protein C5467_19440 [Photorhabdus khanii subsp. guanajuatensis]|uniref:Uncharacterized protein n=1 Tax=Photorhabdus khanii subsp. guanajuatensis TaxID=2100166 RepID=A0A4R4J401_9GAMM|nr:hypothetical protein C5467_19440 [Photorhabdus khanii subsp. guanajuatensis]
MRSFAYTFRDKPLPHRKPATEARQLYWLPQRLISKRFGVNCAAVRGEIRIEKNPGLTGAVTEF